MRASRSVPAEYSFCGSRVDRGAKLSMPVLRAKSCSLQVDAMIEARDLPMTTHPGRSLLDTKQSGPKTQPGFQVNGEWWWWW